MGPALAEADIEGFEDDELADRPITEPVFLQIQQALRNVYLDSAEPKELRRRFLEASVRAPRDWHADAVRKAYEDGDEQWKLTAVFCMRWVCGFDEQILASLESDNPDIRLEAVRAAGTWGIEAAWPHVAALLTSAATDKYLLLDAIHAAVCIRPHEAAGILFELADSEDEEIAEAASEAITESRAMVLNEEDFDDDEEDEDDADSSF